MLQAARKAKMKRPAFASVKLFPSQFCFCGINKVYEVAV